MQGLIASGTVARVKIMNCCIGAWLVLEFSLCLSIAPGIATNLMAAATPTPASPIQFTVAKVFHWTGESSSTLGKSGFKRPATREMSAPQVDSVQLKIVLSNTGPKPLSNLEVKWIALLRGSELKEGRLTASLGIGQTWEKKTDTIPIAKSSDLTGYRMEVRSGDQLMVSTEEPVGLSEKLNKLLPPLPKIP